MNFKPLFQIAFIFIAFAACIGDDFVDDIIEPEIRITSTLDSLQINTSVMLEMMYLNNAGLEEQVNVIWSSSDESVATVNGDGTVSALNFGETTITASFLNGDVTVTDSITIFVGMATSVSNTSISGVINTSSTYKLTGSFVLSEVEDNGLALKFDNDYCASTALPGLYAYLSNNRNNISSGLEIGAVEVFSGAHTYNISNTGINDYSYIVYFCKPFNVKVGDGEL